MDVVITIPHPSNFQSVTLPTTLHLVFKVRIGFPGMLYETDMRNLLLEFGRDTSETKVSSRPGTIWAGGKGLLHGAVKLLLLVPHSLLGGCPSPLLLLLLCFSSSLHLFSSAFLSDMSKLPFFYKVTSYQITTHPDRFIFNFITLLKTLSPNKIVFCGTGG